MPDPFIYPAFWGLCGGALNGGAGLVTAYSAKAGNPQARRKAWLNFALGIFAGPIMAEAFTNTLVAMAPVLDMRFVAMTVGWVGANDPSGFFTLARRVVLSALNASDKGTEK